MLRNEWTFHLEAKALAAASRAKKAHHLERLAFWQAARAKVMTEVRDSGIEVSEGQAGGNYTSTRGIGPQVMVRTDLQRHLTECHGKIQEHNDKTNEFEGWLQVLDGNPDAMLSLHVDDYLFFFGK